MKYSIFTTIIMMLSPIVGYWIWRNDFAEWQTLIIAWIVGFIILIVLALKKDGITGKDVVTGLPLYEQE